VLKLKVQTEKFNEIIELAQTFLKNPKNIPLYYLIAKDGKTIYSNDEISPKTDGNALLLTYVKNYLANLTSDSVELGIYDWESESPDQAVLLKSFGDAESDFFEKISEYEKIDKDSFLKRQYALRYFNLELRLNDKQSIHLHQHISTNFQTTWKLHIKLFEETEKIDVIDYTKGFTIGQNYDFISYVDKDNPQNNFSVVHSLKWFEKLYDLIEEYKEAFEKVGKLTYLDLKTLEGGTEDCWRKCSALLKFSKLDDCFTALNVELTSAGQTLSKDILKEKGIAFRIGTDGKAILAPETPRQLKAALKVLSDKIVDTHLLKRTGISDYIEEFKP
jgi:hypothetical protein